MSVIGSNILAGASGNQGGAYNLTNSLRFRKSASAYLSKTYGTSPTSRTTSTLSMWVKIGSLSNAYNIFFLQGTANNYESMGFVSPNNTNGWVGNSLRIVGPGGSENIRTNQLFRDPSAWYHIVVVYDTTNATSTDRVQLYINGSRVTSFAASSFPAQNTQTVEWLVSSFQSNLGISGGSTTQTFDGYMAEVNCVDGQALTPSSFGETSTTTGVWQPKRYAGTYGTNGFYLPFTDNSALTTSSNVGLGKDFSGNGNYWATNNISITSGVTYDSMTDVPTLTSATASNYPTLNPLIGDATLSSANLNISGVDLSRIGTMAFPTTGKWYFEMTLVANAPSSNWDGVGIGTVPMNTAGGSIYIYRANATKLQTGGSNVSYGSTFETGDVIGVAFDSTAGTLVFYKNNTSQGTAFSGLTGEFFPLVYARGITSSPTLAFNAGQRPFTYTPPTGFVALNTFNLPTPSIGATASTQANKYFDATLYTGNGSTQSIVNAAGFSPDLVWVKQRNGTGWNILTDSVRGANKQLYTNATNSEGSDTSMITALNSNGFSVAYNGGTDVNGSGSSYVAWQWDANGTGVTNTAGSITSTVSANTSSGFSVVTYTGTGANATVGHGLGVAPKMVIVKNRQTAGTSWKVYHIGLTSAAYALEMETTGAEASTPACWNSTAPTSTVVSLGSNAGVNQSSITHVMYCFAPVAGFSAFGKYTGNGSSDGPFVYCGFRPRYVMIKNATNGSDGYWWIHDTARDTYNLADKYLVANGSDAEGTSSAFAIDILSNGFKVRGSNNGVNGNGTTLIYMAFSENPFKYSLAR